MANNHRKAPLPLSLRLLRLAFANLGPWFSTYFAERAYQLWFTTQRYRAPDIERQAKQTARMERFQFYDKAVRLYHWGEGPRVLFIHGWSGRGTQAAHFIAPITQNGYSLLAFDAPAHGDTPGRQTNIMEISELVLALNQHFGEFHGAITHSFGGMILPYALAQGARVNRVASLCPAADIAVLLRNFQNQLCIPDKVMQLMSARLKRDYGADLAQRVSTLNNVATLTIPGLIIHDEADSDIPWQSGKQIADAWQGAEFMLTHGLGHRRILRDPQTVAAVCEFICRR
jgi:pimeloyl-ACP methyl ester carboxylesterase